MIKTWLRKSSFDKSSQCPFLHDLRNRKSENYEYCGQVCQKLFPRSRIVFYGGVACPCDQISFKHVVKAAKQFVK